MSCHTYTWSHVASQHPTRCSRLGVLPCFQPTSLHNLLHVTSDGFNIQLDVLGLVSFHVFSPPPCTPCFMLLVMGLGPRFCDFSFQGSPSCVMCFQVCSFVWTSISLSSLVLVPSVFLLFVCLFIYLFIKQMLVKTQSQSIISHSRI